jgi:hypothetical protein
LLIVVVGLVDAVTSMLGGEVHANNTVSVVDWFALSFTSFVTKLSRKPIRNITAFPTG